ncbi:MAG: hypothetical protein H6726_08715 [Sandaracinaceae bacterium]|nr:hypothetical protein [Sandaracinaceae bacterium]
MSRPAPCSLAAFLLASLSTLTGCGGDGGGDGGTTTLCTADIECSDGRFCNGAERCAPGSADADARGCVAAVSPCLAAQTCDEGAQRCTTECEITGDADGDGHLDVSCGGDDCADNDALRFPGNLEVCDTADHDEDCDPSTFGVRDLDQDGIADGACCNVSGDERFCGRDCDDTAAGVHPNAPEVCDGADNDCDGTNDEGVFATFYRDADGDGYGDPTAPVEHACGSAHDDSENGFDCDDDNDTVRPGAVELCDGVDNNCDGLYERDLDRDGHLDPASVCAPAQLPTDDCNDFVAGIYGGAEERCDGIDNDCDQLIDERADADAVCATTGTRAAYCLDESCIVAACEPLRGDCNRDGSDGCEQDLANDAAHCGACGAACPLGEACVAAACVAPTVVDLAIGEAHGCVLTATGHVGCWGRNEYGQLGQVAGSPRGYVAHAPQLPVARELATTAATTCVIDETGHVVCTGRNAYGERGIGNRGARSGPTEVLGLADAVDLRASHNVACARRPDGSLACWGWGAGLVDATIPVTLAMDVGDYDVGSGTVCGIDGPLSGPWCMGGDESGALGDMAVLPTCMSRSPVEQFSLNAPCAASPTPVATGTALTSIATGGGYTCATTGIAVGCWGLNTFQQALVPPPTQYTQLTALAIAGGPGAPTFTALEAGDDHTCGLRTDGSLMCWGRNDGGQLGRGSVAPYAGLGPVTSGLVFERVVAAGRTTCALDDAGDVLCWGRNTDGQVGDRTSTARSVPTRVLGFETTRALGGGGGRPCAVLSTGDVTCWGDGTPTPEAQDAGAVAVAVASGGRHRCIVTEDEGVRCWGSNENGQLGRGTTTGSGEPAGDVTLPAVRALDAAADTTCAVTTAGEVLCWGNNSARLLATDSVAISNTPVSIPTLDDAVQVALSGSHACARRADGRIRCWGTGTYGELGDGTAADALEPVDVATIDDALVVGVGETFSCALRASGQVWCWGRGDLGQLGAGLTRTQAATPTRVLGLTDIVQLAVSGAGACALDRTGEVHCWGENRSGQLGDGGAGGNAFSAVVVPGLPATAITAHANTRCALDVDAAVRCWGESGAGNAGVVVTNCPGYCDGNGCYSRCPAPVTLVGGL